MGETSEMKMKYSMDKGCPSYYSILGVSSDASSEDIRRAYRKLAMRWHPDRWTRKATTSLLDEAKAKFQQIQEAYSVLSDRRKKTMYDAGLYNPEDEDEDEDDEGFSDFVGEMVSLMSQVRKEGKVYSLEELQSMLVEMAQGFEFESKPSAWYCGPSHFDEPAAPCSKKIRLEGDTMLSSDGSCRIY